MRPWLLILLATGCSARPLEIPLNGGELGADPIDMAQPFGGPEDLRGADLRGADLRAIDLRGADLSMAVPLMAGQFGLYGVTSSDLLIAYSFHDNNVYSISPSTREVKVITKADYAVVRGEIVFLFNGVDAMNGVYDLSTWTPGGGVRPLSQHRTSVIFAPLLSSDGKTAIYFDNVATGGGSGDLITSAIDGSNRQIAAAAIPTGDAYNTDECVPTVQPLGAGFAIGYCKSVDADAGTGEGELITFELALGARHAIITDHPSLVAFTTDASGANAFSIDPAGNGLLFDVSGAIQNVATGVMQARFFPDGTLLYLGTAGTLGRYSPAQKAGTVLETLATNFTSQLFEISPDGKSALMAVNCGGTDGLNCDLWTLPLTVKNAALAQLNSAVGFLPTAEVVGNGSSSFTRDSSYVFYKEPPMGFSGQVHVAPVGGGSDVVVGGLTAHLIVTHGSRALICDNFDDVTSNCELHSVDAAHPRSQPLIDTHVVNYGIYLSPDGTALYYTVNDGARTGIYAQPVP